MGTYTTDTNPIFQTKFFIAYW